MKNYPIILLAGAFFLSSCSDIATTEPFTVPQEEITPDGYITPAKAANIASEFAEYYDAHSNNAENSRAAIRKTSARMVRDLYIPNSRSDNSQIYVVNFEDNNGFALVSKKETTAPVLAFIEKGSFNDETAAKIEGFRDFTDYANQTLASWPHNPPIIPTYPTDTVSPKERNDSAFKFQGQLATNKYLIGLKWGQEGIYAKYTPNGNAGCGAVAVAQIMAYHANRFPTLQITYNGSNKQIELDWDKIRTHKADNNYWWDRTNIALRLPNNDPDTKATCPWARCTADSHDQIGLLIREVGERISSVYYSDGSTSTSRFGISIDLANNLGFDNSQPPRPYSARTITRCIDKKRPLLIFGERSASDGNLLKHIWVCDGYMEKTEEDETTNQYFHFNWGYDGDFNGFFLAGVFHMKPNWPEYTNIKIAEVDWK